MVNGVLLALNDWLKHYFPNVILLFLKQYYDQFWVITIFGVIFKVLPDANIRWKDVRGAFFYGLSIYVGSLLIGLYLT
jgi:membrane protein